MYQMGSRGIMPFGSVAMPLANLLDDSFLSLLRWMSGWLIGSLIGLLCASGHLATNYRRFGSIAMAVDFMRAIPILALVPVFQTFMGIEETTKLAIVSWAVAFPVWVSITSAANIEPRDRYLLVMSISRGRFDKLRYLRAPAVSAGLAAGMRISIGIGWISVVAAELIGTYTRGFWAGGLGYRLDLAYQNNSWGTMAICIGLFGLFGLTTARLLNPLLVRMPKVFINVLS